MNDSRASTNGAGTLTVGSYPDVKYSADLQGAAVKDFPQERVLSVAVTVRKGMFDHGYDQAVAGGDLVAREETVAAIKRHAEGVADECERDLFDSDAYAHDGMYRSEHEKHLADRGEAEIALKFAEAASRENEHSTAMTTTVVTNDDSRMLLACVAVFGFALGFIVTYHDFFFDFSNEAAAWLVSGVAAAITGGAIAALILSDGYGEQRSGANWMGLVAGILVAVAFFFIRIQDAVGLGEYAFAAGLTIYEIGLALGLEGAAIRIRRSRYETKVKVAEQTRAQAVTVAAQKHLERCRERVQILNTTVQNDIAYVEERSVRYLNIPQLREDLVAAGLDGYNAGIAANRGRVRGITTERRTK